MTYFCYPSFTAQCESEGSWPVRDQGESAGWAGQQVTAYTRTRRTSRRSFDMEDESRFCGQLLSQQARWAARAVELTGYPALVLSKKIVKKLFLGISCTVKQTYCTFCPAGFSHRRLGVFGSSVFHRQYHRPLKEVCSELQFLPGEKLTLNTEPAVVKLSMCMNGCTFRVVCNVFGFPCAPLFSMGPESGFQDTSIKGQTNAVWLWRSGGVWALHTSLPEGQHVTAQVQLLLTFLVGPFCECTHKTWGQIKNKKGLNISFCFHYRDCFRGKRDQRHNHWTNWRNKGTFQRTSRRPSRRASLRGSWSLRPSLREHKACGSLS